MSRENSKIFTYAFCKSGALQHEIYSKVFENEYGSNWGEYDHLHRNGDM